MMKVVTARKMGGSIGATIPKEMADRLRIKEGDRLTLVLTTNGLLVSPFDPTFEKALAVYERGARKYRNALRELASS